MKKALLKTKIKSVTAILACSVMLATPLSQAYVLPVIDGAKLSQDAINWALDAADRATTLANWVTQLQNWQQNLSNLVRGQMADIPGFNKLINKKTEEQFKSVFERRKKKCQGLKSNSVALCINTVNAEEEKLNLILQMQNDLESRYNAIKSKASQHNGLSNNNQSGEKDRIEIEVLGDRQGLQTLIEHYRARIDAQDKLIEQLKWARKQLTLDQLNGQQETINALKKSAASIALQKNARDYRRKAAGLNQNAIRSTAY